MQSEGSHQDNLLNLAPAGGGLHSRQLGLESLTHRGTSEGMDKYDENLTLEKYSQVTSGRIVKYNGDTSGSGMDKYSMGIEKYGRETSMGASGLDKYRERFRQDRCRYANELERDNRPCSSSPSPSDVYRFNGEVVRTKGESWEGATLQELFREQEPLDYPSVQGLDLAAADCLVDCKPIIPPPAHQTGSLLWPDLTAHSKLGYGDLLSGRNVNGGLGRLDRCLSSPTSDSSRHSDSYSSEAESIRLGKDEKLAREAGITFDVKDIVNFPMDEFNDLLSKRELTEEQLNLCRDIRRRGKNKVAAQNCRKRKIDQIEELQDRLGEAIRMKSRLKNEHERLVAEYEEEQARLERLSEKVLHHHNKSPAHYEVQVVGEDQVKILPKSPISERGHGTQAPERVRREGAGEAGHVLHRNHSHYMPAYT